METKANYVLIGAFALFGLFAAMAMLLWLAKYEIDRTYSYYDILFDNVSGLNQAGDVRYNGLPVGQVVGLRLDDVDPSKVRVRIEINASTPVKTDTIAVLQSQGVTGVSFVALSGGSPEATILPEGEIIQSETSAIQTLLDGAPELLNRAIRLIEDVNEVFNTENRAKITEVLDNVASASARLDRTLEDFEDLSDDLGSAARDVASFSNRLDALSDTAETTLSSATKALDATTDLMTRAQPVIDNADATLGAMRTTFDSATLLIETDLGDLARRGSTAATEIENTLITLRPQAENAMASLTRAIDEAQAVFAGVNELFEGDGSTIFAEARVAVNAFSKAVESASSDFTLVSQDVLRASNSAAEFTGMLEDILAENQRQVSSFLRVGLPEFLRLTEEARLLVSNLDRFVSRVQRDPARFFLGTQGSEFSR